MLIHKKLSTIKSKDFQTYGWTVFKFTPCLHTGMSHVTSAYKKI